LDFYGSFKLINYVRSQVSWFCLTGFDFWVWFWSGFCFVCFVVEKIGGNDREWMFKKLESLGWVLVVFLGIWVLTLVLIWILFVAEELYRMERKIIVFWFIFYSFRVA
jgi:hypothetical protein